ncbi:glycosyltransferase family 4 protein [Micromonospora sp. NPDC051925]|uniref:glycosyltransferase family 4 protein n=1 Tax=Micromonospora sp. NPDC051925 TaxID=3364288 RepID=UPI0037C7D43C
MNIAFVLLTYRPDAPAGIERSIAALATGLRLLGHRALILTATLPPDVDAARIEPDMIRLRGVRLPDPATEADLLAALADPASVQAEVTDLLGHHQVDLVCWADASWGLGYLASAPPRVRTALMVRVPRSDELFDQALRSPDVVLTNSRFMVDECARLGYDIGGWEVIPNGLLALGTPAPSEVREALRRAGPVRVVARAEPHKGVRELVDAMPASLGRPLEVVLAAASFEYWPGMQAQVLDECRHAATLSAGEVRILPPLPWREVSPFLGGAALTLVGSTSPETFGNAAAEALAVGTPVVAYGIGHVPELAGPAGVMVPLESGPGQLWEAAQELLADPRAYHRAAASAPARIAGHTPQAAARAFLAAVTPGSGDA